jgi:hypothetical protein
LLAILLQVSSWQNGCNVIETSTNPAYTRMGGVGPMKVIPSDITIGIWGIAALSGNIIARLNFLSGRASCGVQQRPLILMGTGVQGGSRVVRNSVKWERAPGSCSCIWRPADQHLVVQLWSIAVLLGMQCTCRQGPE